MRVRCFKTITALLLVLVLAGRPAFAFAAEVPSGTPVETVSVQESDVETGTETPAQSSEETSADASGETPPEEPASSDAPQETDAPATDPVPPETTAVPPESTAPPATEPSVPETTVPEETPTETEPEPPVEVIELNGPDIKARTYCVIDAETNEILISKDPHKRMYPASTTKVMTALLVLENIDDLDQTLTFTKSAVHIDPSSSTLGPKAGVGEVMTVRDALYGMLLSSANECGAMLGEFVGGSEEAFAAMMNARAEKIGAHDTHFVNAYGIHHPDHYTTAYDLCLILKEAMKNPRYRKLNQTVEYRIPKTNMCGERLCVMGHAMLNGSVEERGVIGGKTGSTPQAGRCLVTAVDRDGLYTVSALMNSDINSYYKDEQVLLEYTYGFHNRQIPPVEWVPTHDFVKAAETVKLRYSPSLLGAEYGAFEKGHTLERAGIYGDWSQIIVEGAGVFYAYSEYVTSLQPEKVPETTPYAWPTEAPTTEAPTTAAEMPGTKKQEDTEERTAPATAESGTEEEDVNANQVLEILMIVLPVVIILLLALIWVLVYLRRKKRRRRRKK
ncbi:MAG: serine hydrolase [Lachnospiraceae bacterium]|nr:serine hydrolase [Lachnospiraceae bacterium]